MPRYHFKLIDSRIVSDHGIHELPDEVTAHMEAVKLARSLRTARQELIGQNCFIAVTDEWGASVCVIPLDEN